MVPRLIQTVRHRFCRVAAIIRGLGVVGGVVLARPPVLGASFLSNLDGKRRPAGNCRLACLSALAVAGWFQRTILCASDRPGADIQFRLDRGNVRPRLAAQRKVLAGILVLAVSRPANDNRNLAVWALRRGFLRGADAGSPAGKGDTRGARRGARGRSPSGCRARATESSFPV